MSILNAIISLILSVVPSSRLLVPQGEMPEKGWPAVLLLHDHGARFEKGWQKVIGSNPEPYYSGMAIGDSLVAHGYVVYCADALYWGSRHSNLTQRQFSDSLGGEGMWYAQVLVDDKAGVTYLRSLPYVDSTRIAAAGFSYGAYRAWNLASEDPRVHVCIAAHWMTTLAQNRYNDSWLCMCRKGIYPLNQSQITNHKLPITNFAAVAANIAPRPFLLQYGTQDKLFPVSAVDSCEHYIDSVYQMTNYQLQITNHAFRSEKYACGHIFTHEHLKNWLIWLKMHL